jgi:hypothetical protein
MPCSHAHALMLPVPILSLVPMLSLAAKPRQHIAAGISPQIPNRRRTSSREAATANYFCRRLAALMSVMQPIRGLTPTKCCHRFAIFRSRKSESNFSGVAATAFSWGASARRRPIPPGMSSREAATPFGQRCHKRAINRESVARQLFGERDGACLPTTLQELSDSGGRAFCRGLPDC